LHQNNKEKEKKEKKTLAEHIAAPAKLMQAKHTAR